MYQLVLLEKKVAKWLCPRNEELDRAPKNPLVHDLNDVRNGKRHHDDLKITDHDLMMSRGCCREREYCCHYDKR